MRNASFASGLSIAVLTACAAGATPGGGSSVGAAGAGPVIETVMPDSVPAGEAYPVRLEIRGGGFHTSANIIRLGRVLVDTVPAVNETLIRWDMPKTVLRATEVPPMVIDVGEYPLTVETPAGVSDPVTLVLYGMEDA